MQHSKTRVKPNDNVPQSRSYTRPVANEVLSAAGAAEGVFVEWAYEYSRSNEVSL